MKAPEVKFEHWIEPEYDYGPEGNFDDEDTVRWIREQMDAGNDAAWCSATVKAVVYVEGPDERSGQFFSAEDHLGGVSYETEKELWEGLQVEMEQNALDALLAQMRKYGEMAGRVLVAMDQVLEDPGIQELMRKKGR